MNRKVSLKDIAQKVGVSIALVSYVLNGKKEGRISKEIAAKIKATAKKLDYRPNQIAKSLKSNRTNTIGLIVADIANPFSSSLARIIEDEAEKNGYTVIFGSSDEKAERSQRLVEVLLDRQVDGIIIAPAAGTEAQIKALQKRSIPLVLVDRYFPDMKVNFVTINNFEAAFAGVSHLLESGCRRIGIVAFKTKLLHLQDRKRGYLHALKKNKVAVSKSLIKEVAIDETTSEEVEAAIEQLLQLPDKIDSLFFASNKISTYGLKYLNRLKVKVPKDIKILSFDQSDAAELFYASLTHVRQPLHQIGQQAVQILIENINGNKKITQLQLDAKLVLGQSTGK
ncbi:MAG: LacI family DNA-binding transcriptional regulator [Chitinophagaceae bacterium]